MGDKAEALHDNANDAAQQIYEKSEAHLHALQRASRKEQHSASRDRRQQVHDAVETLKSAAEATKAKTAQTQGDDIDDNEHVLERMQKQMESVQKGLPASPIAAEASQEILVAPGDFSGSYLLAVGSLGLLLFVYFRRTRPTPVDPP